MANKIVGDAAIQLSSLLNALETARSKEREAKAQREAIELQISMAIGVPDTWAGVKTFAVGDEWKMTAKRSMNIKVDNEVFAPIQAANPELAGRLFRTKFELNRTEWKGAAEDVKKLFAPAITSTPGKVGIVAEPINN